jgi:hydroxypyruvate isomerase
MLRLAANLSLQFNDVRFLERFACAARAGFDAVEFNFVSNVDSMQISRQLREHQLLQVLAGMPGAASDKGLAAIPGRQAEFRERLLKGLEFAAEANCPLLHVTTGVVSADEREQGAHAFIENIEYAVTVADQFKVTLVVEAINQRDAPGYFIRSLGDALQWVDTITARAPWCSSRRCPDRGHPIR